MRLLCIAAVFVLSCVLTVRAFNCSTACDVLSPGNAATSQMYQVSVNSLQYQPGSSVQVTASSYNDTFPYKALLLQAKGMGSLQPVGVMMSSANAVLFDCGRRPDGLMDTLCISGEVDLDVVKATWYPPQVAGEIRHVDIQGVFVDNDGGEHRQHSVLLSENVTVEEEPEVNLHDEKTEMELVIIQKEKEQQLIDQENLASEDDIGKRAREEKEEHDKEVLWEETQYEQAMKDEEDALRARIQAELKDKEEYDRLMFEKEEKERELKEQLERERQEREREEREREEREREKWERERDRENETIDKGPGEEIDMEDREGDKTNRKVTAGGARLAVVSMATIMMSSLVFVL